MAACAMMVWAILGAPEPDPRQQARQILARLDQTFESLRREVRDGIRGIVLRELEGFGAVQDEAALAEIRRLADQIADDEENRLLRRALRNPEAQRELLRQLRALELTPQQAVEQLFVRGEDGRYRVRPEHRERLEAIARAYVQQAPGPPPSPPPSPPPQRAQPHFGFRADSRHEGPGVRVLDVQEGGPAGQAGLRAGDILLRVQRQPVTFHNLGVLLGRFAPGDQVEFTILRDGEEQTITVTVGRR